MPRCIWCVRARHALSRGRRSVPVHGPTICTSACVRICAFDLAVVHVLTSTILARWPTCARDIVWKTGFASQYRLRAVPGAILCAAHLREAPWASQTAHSLRITLHRQNRVITAVQLLHTPSDREPSPRAVLATGRGQRSDGVCSAWPAVARPSRAVRE